MDTLRQAIVKSSSSHLRRHRRGPVIGWFLVKRPIYEAAAGCVGIVNGVVVGNLAERNHGVSLYFKPVVVIR